MKKHKVIGFAGQQRAGKDTAADYVAGILDWERIAFASEVKRIFCETFNVDLDFVEKWKVINEPPPGFDMNVRKSLQFIGDGFRQIQGNIWVEKPFRDRKVPCIVSDVRYPNELKKISSLGGVNVLVWRPGFENDDPNGSEAKIRPVVDFFADQGVDGLVPQSLFSQLINQQCCANVPEGALFVDVFLINNGNVEDLYRKIDDIVLPYIIESFQVNGEQYNGKEF